MLLIRVAAALALAQLGMAATSTTTSSTAAIPTCGLTGWDASGTNIGYYADSSSANYSSYSACNALCNANTDCESFAYDAGVACILYNQTAETNVNTDSASPWTFFDRGGSCPPSSTTSTTASSTTSSAAAATATCTGFEGYDAGSNIGYYTGSGTYSACYALCNANSACLSFGITSDSAACILYNYTVEGNDVSSPGSGNFFYDRGGVCPSSSSSSSASSSRTSSSATSSATTPVQTGAFPNCPSNLVPYNVNTYATPYMPCNSSYPASACMSDNDGTSTYCNLCLTCSTDLCSTDSDCSDGYACIKNSDCPVDGYDTGVAVCLYMLAGGSDYGCYDSTNNA